MARRTAKKRSFDPISLSFLDVISCGFGAVVLIFLILDHSISTNAEVSNPDIMAEVNLLNDEIQQGEAGLVRVRNTVSDVDLQMVQAQGLARSIQVEIDTFLEELAQLENESTTSDNSVDKLKSDIEALEAELERLKAAQDDMNSGNNVRSFIGEGNRQYLTGLILGGNRILILVDVSGSMLDSTIVNIIRRRNMSEEAQLASEKWVQVRKTVEWLTAQMPIPSQYQILLFNSETTALIPGTEGQWLEVADKEQLEIGIELLNKVVPAKGTNLDNVINSISSLGALPDNVYLITDGLPTLSNHTSTGNNITGREREKLFDRAIRDLPGGIPVNVILTPLEGDPMASALYWQLAIHTGGSFLNPSADWP